MERTTNATSQKPKSISWEIPEYDNYERDKRWNIVAGSLAVLLIIYSLATYNFLFAVIILITGMIFIMRHGKEPPVLVVSLTGEGVRIGQKTYEYDMIKDFFIVYKPRMDIKKIYFEFNSIFRHRLSVPLRDMNPLPIREFLLQYLHEDTERTNPPISEGLAKLLKL